jgi:hypothetical protein
MTSSCRSSPRSAATRGSGLQHQRRHRRRRDRRVDRCREAGLPHRHRRPAPRRRRHEPDPPGHRRRTRRTRRRRHHRRRHDPQGRSCTAVRHGVHRAHILDGRIAHVLLLEIFTDAGIGTMIMQPRDEAQEEVTQMSTSTSPCVRPRPDGELSVHAGVRTTGDHVRPGRGTELWDSDGKRYLDFLVRHRRRVARARESGRGRGGRRAGSSNDSCTCRTSSPTRWPPRPR